MTKNIHEITDFMPPSGSFTPYDLKYLGRTRTRRYPLLLPLLILVAIVSLIHFFVEPQFLSV